jgi:hypothetical protein
MMKIGVGIDGTSDERTLWADEDNRKACAATPAKTLEERIMNPHIGKSDAEWWAYHEIEQLRSMVRSNAHLYEQIMRIDEELIGAYGSVETMSDKELRHRFGNICAIVKPLI